MNMNVLYSTKLQEGTVCNVVEKNRVMFEPNADAVDIALQMFKEAVSRSFLLFFPVCFFTSYKLKHVNEILIQRWNLTYMTDTDDFQSFFRLTFSIYHSAVKTFKCSAINPSLSTLF